MKNQRKFFALAFPLLILSSSCTEDSETVDPVPQSSLPYQELYDQGADRYLGVFSPTSTNEVSPGTTEYFFDIPDGPICFTGNDFSMFTRDGSSSSLLIFLQGGGFCSPVACAAVEEGLPLFPVGILDPNDPESAVANFDLGYVPYCDGSSMIGDREVDSDGDGVNDRFFRGAQNLSASLDVIASKYPAPDKIVLAGNSAGGFAVHHALPLLRLLYPDVKIFVINDSGPGIMDAGGYQTLLDYWNGRAFYPASCASCVGADGNLTDYHQYQLAQDPNIEMAYISSMQDETFAQLTSGGGPAYEAQLFEASNELNASFPERFNSLIAAGDNHTFIMREYTYSISETTVRQWISDMVTESNDWVSRAD